MPLWALPAQPAQLMEPVETKTSAWSHRPWLWAQQAEHPGTGVNASHVDLRDLGGFQDLETANERQAAALAAVAQRRAD